MSEVETWITRIRLVKKSLMYKLKSIVSHHSSFKKLIYIVNRIVCYKKTKELKKKRAKKVDYF